MENASWISEMLEITEPINSLLMLQEEISPLIGFSISPFKN